ncbi:MAG TPA: hypothetical protein PKN23_06255 [Candidatus Hydrogenedentes bacterium]|nr:hypothetical protein [Candidatus Hydrogenedentota bacterium]HOH50384.1 hypothetical protein [Candidatus Hydrogenedentota bacterium]HQL93098.1 hypothetical protein [Candidatus Hydrogenedentota bacterium]
MANWTRVLLAALFLCPTAALAQEVTPRKLYVFEDTAAEGRYWACGPRVFAWYMNPSGKLIVSDGTPGGTREMVFPGKEGRQAIVLAADDFTAYFAVSEGGFVEQSPYTLWRMDSGDDVPVMVTDRVFAGRVHHHQSRFLPGAVMHRNRLYWGTDHALWCSDGTIQGTLPLVSFPPESFYSGLNTGTCYNFPSALFPLGDRLVFNAYDEEAGLCLWTTDGTPAGTGVAADLFTLHDIFGEVGQTNSNRHHVLVDAGWSLGGVVKVSVTRAYGGDEGVSDLAYFDEKHYLLRTNGSDIEVLPGQDAPTISPALIGAQICGPDNSGLILRGLCLNLTTMEASATPLLSSGMSFMGGLHAELGGRFILAVDSDAAGVRGLHSWNPSGGALTPIKPIDWFNGYPMNDPAVSPPLVKCGGWVYFSWEDAAHGVSLWRTNGTPGETELAADMDDNVSSASPLMRCGALFAHRQRLFFVQVDNNAFTPPDEKGKAALWVIDHVPSGTAPRAVIYGTGSRVAEGSTVTLRAGGDGLLGHLSYEWFFNGQSLGVYTATLTLTDVTAFNAGAYTVRVYDDSKGVHESEPFVLEVLAEGALPLGAGAGLAVLLAAAGARTLRRRTKTAGRVT